MKSTNHIALQWHKSKRRVCWQTPSFALFRVVTLRDLVASTTPTPMSTSTSKLASNHCVWITVYTFATFFTFVVCLREVIAISVKSRSFTVFLTTSVALHNLVCPIHILWSLAVFWSERISFESHLSAPAGTLTFHRRSLRSFPNWANCSSELCKLHVTSRGTIETDGAGMLQVTFFSFKHYFAIYWLNLELLVNCCRQTLRTSLWEAECWVTAAFKKKYASSSVPKWSCLVSSPKFLQTTNASSWQVLVQGWRTAFEVVLSHSVKMWRSSFSRQVANNSTLTQGMPATFNGREILTTSHPRDKQHGICYVVVYQLCDCMCAYLQRRVGQTDVWSGRNGCTHVFYWPKQNKSVQETLHRSRTQ